MNSFIGRHPIWSPTCNVFTVKNNAPLSRFQNPTDAVEGRALLPVALDADDALLVVHRAAVHVVEVDRDVLVAVVAGVLGK